MSADEEEQDVDQGLEEQVDLMKGEDALVATADLLYQKMSSDANMQTLLGSIELSELASKLQKLLVGVFDGDWPEMEITPHLLDDCYDGLASLISESVQKSGGGEGSLLSSLDNLSEFADDERWTTFVEYVQSAVVTAEDAEAEGEQTEEDHHANE